MNLLAALTENLKKLGEGQATIMRGVNQNAKRIQALETRKEAPLIPPEIMKQIPGILEGLAKALFAPETPPEAKRGDLFTDKLVKAYEASMLKQLDINAQTAAANLNRILLDNKRIQKQLEGEF